MQVDERGMLGAPGLLGEPDRAFADVEGLENIRIRGRRAGLQVPKTPDGAHHQGFHEKRRHVGIVGKARYTRRISAA